MAVILLIAIVGNFGGASIAGLICELEKSEAAALGILLNARGLVELIVLNIGYQAGILSATLFSMMIVCRSRPLLLLRLWCGSYILRTTGQILQLVQWLPTQHASDSASCGVKFIQGMASALESIPDMGSAGQSSRIFLFVNPVRMEQHLFAFLVTQGTKARQED